MTFPSIVTNFNNPNLRNVIDLDILLPNSFLSGASAVYLGGGFVLSAAHNFASDPFNPIQGMTNFNFNTNFPGREVTVLEGTSFEDTLSPIGSQGNIDYYGIQGHDLALFQVDQSSVSTTTENADPRMIIYADPNDASGTLYSAGYPNTPTVGNGETLYEASGTLSLGSHVTSGSVFGSNGYSAWITDAAGFPIYPGMSGGAVWLTTTLPDGQTGQFLAGVVSGILGSPGTPGSNATIEDISGNYNGIAQDIFGGLGVQQAQVLANQFGRHVIIADNTGGIFQGTQFNEDFHGSGSGDFLFGLAGHDKILGFAGDDLLDGGDGIDEIYGGDGNDYISGGAGDDYISGGTGDDYIIGGSGADFIVGNSGTDTYVDSFDGGAIDTLSKIETIINIGDGSYSIVGSGGFFNQKVNDIALVNVHPSSEVTSLSSQLALSSSAQAENTKFDARQGLEIRGPEELSESVYNGDMSMTVHQNGNLTLNDHINDETMLTITDFNWGDGNIYLDTGREGMSLLGTESADKMSGTRDADLMVGAAGDDILSGGRGNDELSGEHGDDYLSGERGNDSLYGDRGSDYLDGGRGNDSLWGGADTDYLIGGRGDDQLSGGQGDDYLSGGRGDDTLIGGAGNDYLWGGKDNDTFVFETGGGKDVIIDFDTGSKRGVDDLIDFNIDGFDDFASLMSVASQIGRDILFDFGNGDSLMLQNVDMDGLTADMFI